MVIRNADDGEGELCVPIDWKVNHADVKSAQAAREWRIQSEELRHRQEEQRQVKWDLEHQDEVPASKLKMSRRVVLCCDGNARVVLMPKAETLVMMRAQRGGQPVCDQELVWAPGDDDPVECCLVKHVIVSHADDPRLGIILRTDDEGFVSVNVTNTSGTPLEFDAGDALLALRPADLRFCSAHSKVPEEVWNGLSVDDAAALSAYQATWERTSLGGKLKSHGNGGESWQSHSKTKE